MVLKNLSGQLVNLAMIWTKFLLDTKLECYWYKDKNPCLYWRSVYALDYGWKNSTNRIIFMLWHITTRYYLQGTSQKRLSWCGNTMKREQCRKLLLWKKLWALQNETCGDATQGNIRKAKRTSSWHSSYRDIYRMRWIWTANPPAGRTVHITHMPRVMVATTIRSVPGSHAAMESWSTADILTLICGCARR